MMDKEFYDFWLSRLPGVGSRTFCHILQETDHLQDMYETGEIAGINLPGKIKEAIKSPHYKEQAKKEWKKLKEKNIQWISYGSPLYPSRLRFIYSPPKGIYIRGTLWKEKTPALGIVGARECTYYGRDMARWFGFRLARAGMLIVSGLAKGVDGWAHRGALEAEGQTCAVLGCGADICYPERNKSLYEEIQKKGIIVSEFAPGTKARPEFFPMRNRIISGLSDGLLVVEAREKSGSLITASQALEQGKDVFVIPGRIGDNLSVGCNRLLQSGANLVLHPDDILQYYQMATGEEQMILTKEQKMIWDCLGEEPCNLYSISQSTNIPISDIIKHLLEWKKKKFIEEVTQGYFVKI